MIAINSEVLSINLESLEYIWSSTENDTFRNSPCIIFIRVFKEWLSSPSRKNKSFLRQNISFMANEFQINYIALNQNQPRLVKVHKKIFGFRNRVAVIFGSLDFG